MSVRIPHLNANRCNVLPQHTKVTAARAVRSTPKLLLQALMDPANAIDYAEEVKEEYDQLRSEFFAGLQDIVYTDMQAARARAFQVR
jgi:hypothetical protein